MNAARASFLALLLCWAGAALALVAVPPLTGRVVDQTGTLSAGDIASLTQTLRDLETRKGSQIAVLIVPTTDGEAIEQYALRVAEAWKIGRKKIDDGALLVIAKNDRRLRIEVGYGLEGALTDATTKRIIDEDITPKFKAGDFAGGISAGRQPNDPADRHGEKLPEPEPPHWRDSRSVRRDRPCSIRSSSFRRIHCRRHLCGACWAGWSARLPTGGFVGVAGLVLRRLARVAAVIVGVVAFALRAVQRRIHVSGAGPPRQLWRLVRRLRRLRSSSGSSSSGGFSGGGGSFGGGGASGSW